MFLGRRLLLCWPEISFLKKCVGLSSGWQIKISIFHSQIFASTFQMEYFNKTWQSGLRCQLDFLHCLDADLSLFKSRSQTYFSPPETWWTFILTFQASNNSPPATQQQKEFLVDLSENLGEYNCYLRGIYCTDKYQIRKGMKRTDGEKREKCFSVCFLMLSCVLNNGPRQIFLSRLH